MAAGEKQSPLLTKMSNFDQKPRVGVGVMILKNGRVLLGRRNGDPQKADSELHGEGTWTMPGGKLHFGEEFEEAAAREVFEEIGCQINPKNLKQISVTNDIVEDAHFITIGFLCKDFKGTPKAMEPEEIVEWKWFALNDLPSPLYFPSEKILKNFSLS